MNKELMQFIALIIVVAFVFFFYRLLISLKNVKRISAFAITSKKNNDNLESIFFSFVHKISTFLSRLVIFNGVAKSYNKYLRTESSGLKSGMDFISLKFISAALITALYFFGCALYQTSINTTVAFLSFLAGFFAIDVYLKIKNESTDKINTSDILASIIIITNSLKANRSLEQALNSVILKSKPKIANEYRSVLHDLKLGLSIQEAFSRMYERTNIKKIDHIAKVLSLVNKSGVNIIEIFSSIEEDLIEEQKTSSEIKQINKFNNFFYLVLLFIPLIFTFFFILNNLSLNSLKKYFIPILIVEGPLYIFYIIVLYYTLRGDENA